MSATLKKIDPVMLVPMDSFAGEYPLRVELVYAQADHKDNIFKAAIYKPDARLWLHKDLAEIVKRASKLVFEQHGYKMLLFDGLRTTDAQAKIMETDIVQANPQWLEEGNRLFSPPGKGGHPRGMAIDITLETEDWEELDMGTAFDELPLNGAGPDVNKAHRDTRLISDTAGHNRDILTGFMLLAAKELSLPLHPLTLEWWDFRFPAEHYDVFAPLSDADLPVEMQMVSAE